MAAGYAHHVLYGHTSPFGGELDKLEC